MTKLSKIINAMPREVRLKIALAAMRRGQAPSNSASHPKAPSQKMTMPAPTLKGSFEAGKPPAKSKEENLSGVEINPGGGDIEGGPAWPEMPNAPKGTS
jgi:hypothetical protein